MSRFDSGPGPMREVAMLCGKGEWARLPRVPDSWLFEPKLDGTRIVAERTAAGARLINRRAADKARAFPEVVEALRSLPGEFAVDGEMAVPGPGGRADFSALAARDHTGDPSRIRILSRAKPATLFCFDLLRRDGRDLTRRPLRERKGELADLLRAPPMDTRLALLSPEPKEALLLRAERGDIEGIVAKDPGSPYLFERSPRWLKFRKQDTDDIPIIGFQTSDKEGRAGVRSLLGLLGGREIAVASGLDGAELARVAREFRTRPHRVEKKRLLIEPPYPVAEVRHFRTEGMAVRFPRFVRWRAE